MLKDGVVLAVVLLLVVGAGFLWWSKTPNHIGAPTQDTQVQQPEPAPKPAAVVRARPRVKPEATAVVEEIAETTPALPTAPVVVAAAPTVHRDPMPFPAVEQIRTGVHEDS